MTGPPRRAALFSAAIATAGLLAAIGCSVIANQIYSSLANPGMAYLKWIIWIVSGVCSAVIIWAAVSQVHQLVVTRRAGKNAEPKIVAPKDWPVIGLLVLAAVLIAFSFPMWSWLTRQELDVGSTFTSTMYVGDQGDLLANSGSLFTYTPKGEGPHEWEWKYISGQENPAPAKFAGVIYFRSTLTTVPGATPGDGFPIECCRSKIVWEARSGGGPVKAEFVCGGIDWTWTADHQQTALPYGDTLHKLSLGTYTLTEQWQRYEYRLSDARRGKDEFRRVIGGFGWVMHWPSDHPEPARKMVIELRNIRYQS